MESLSTTDDKKTFNINAPLTSSLEAVNDNYQATVNIVATLMGLSAAQSQQQAALSAEFNQIEHDSPAQLAAAFPNGVPNGWTDNLYLLENANKSDSNYQQEITQYSTGYSADQSSFNSVNQAMSSTISQINTITQGNTQAESTTQGVGTAVATFQQGVSRLITY